MLLRAGAVRWCCVLVLREKRSFSIQGCSTWLAHAVVSQARDQVVQTRWAYVAIMVAIAQIATSRACNQSSSN